MKDNVMATLLIVAWMTADIGTFAYLMVNDWAYFNAWNWIIMVPINIFLAQLWPIYWPLHLLGVFS